MTKSSKPEPPLSDHEKQKVPLKGEVSPEEAATKAMAFAAQAKARMASNKK